MPKEIKLPQWGMNMNDGTVVKWLKSIGEDVSKGDDLVEIESTKVNAAVEATEAGKLGRIDIKEGDLVPVGTVLGMILLEGESESDIPDKLIDNKEENNEIKPKENIILNKKVIASPRARSLAKKLEIDISDLLGTGPSGRITEEDVRLFSENLNISDKTIYSIKESIPSTGIRQIIAKRMFESAQNPQVTLNTVACVDSLFELQKTLISNWRREKIRPQVNDILLKIVSDTLITNPKLNAHYNNQSLDLIENINLGVAMAVKDGLVVPVIVDSQKKDFLEISKEIRTFSKKIKSNQLLPDDITGSTFTISNLSSYNVEYFNPIINPPEVAILGVGKISNKIDLDENKEVVVKKIIHLSLTFDHRALDGVPASNFLDSLVKNIESI
ncbi:MAG: 2-oxo acid dehydrogenase subunit E2 [Dehalococcoidia bacterium]|nr:2-oxo acid dehydrogenase subunit E2 [Dehalococcoidia bacterium]